MREQFANIHLSNLDNRQDSPDITDTVTITKNNITKENKEDEPEIIMAKIFGLFVVCGIAAISIGLCFESNKDLMTYLILMLTAYLSISIINYRSNDNG